MTVGKTQLRDRGHPPSKFSPLELTLSEADNLGKSLYAWSPPFLLMVFIERKKKKGKMVLYLTHKARINGKSKRVLHIYLGPEAQFIQQARNIKLDLKQDVEITTYDFGLPIVLMQLANRLDLINIINQCTPKRHQGLSVGEYMLIATLNRCIQPKSKNQIRNWFYSTYLHHAFPAIQTYLDSMAYTNHFHYLTEERIEAIETRLAHQLFTEFQVKMEELLYDPTNFATFINPHDQALPKHGHSKEGRAVLNLVSLSVFCTKDNGIPIMHRVYPGNVQDAAHFKKEFPRFLARLQDLGIEAPEVTLVFDKGNISPEVFHEIDRSDIRWVASVRPSSHKDLHHLVPTDFPMVTLPNKKSLGILEFPRELHGRTRRLLVLYNPRRAHWAGQNLTQKLTAKITTVHEWFQTRLNKKKWRSPDAVKQKIAALIQKPPYLKFLDYTVTGTYGAVHYQIQVNETALQPHLATYGKSFLMSNHPTKSALELVWLYRQQYTVERAFSYLKNTSFVRITPMFVWKDECIRGHIFTCVLALLLLTLLGREVNTQFPEMSLPQIVEWLSEIQIARVKLSGSQKLKQKIVEISPEAKKLADFFQLASAF